MRIRFDLGQSSYSRHFLGVIEALGRRGHAVETEAFWDDEVFLRKPIATADHRQILMRKAKVRGGSLGLLGYFLRCARDRLLYRRPGFASESLVARRISNHLTMGLEGEDNVLGMQLARFIESLSSEQAMAFDGLLTRIENLIPHDPGLEQVLSPEPTSPKRSKSPFGFRASPPVSSRPDVLCITPLVVTQIGQAELVKAAKALGIPVVFLANSWDNLTTKGTIHVKPDWTIVWNQVQAREAVDLHGIPEESILVTGAPRFDDFFARRPAQTREEFFRAHRLDSSRPAITYLGSSNLISADETSFVRQWIQTVRGSSCRTLSQANLILRPHPKFRTGWEEIGSEGQGIAVCASEGLNNDDLLYHCLYHSQAVVGVNTSAELEAAILHKPVLTIKDPSFDSGQEGTIHFHYLLKAHGGFVEKAEGLAEHADQLARVVSEGDVPARNREFLERFLRPGGLERPAAEVTADAICTLLERSKK